MAAWGEIVAQEPEFAARVRERFEAHTHKTIATLRSDGAPRISGIEATFTENEVWLGSMPDSVKGRDLLRDPRFALHSASVDPPEDDPSGWQGDAKLSGRALHVTSATERAAAFAAMSGGDPEAPSDIPVFRLSIDTVVLTRVGSPADHLVLEVWQEGRGLRHVKRT